MPRVGPRRENVIFRMSAAGIELVDQRAADEGLTRSELLRVLIQFGLNKMPPGWRPKP